MNTVKFGQFLKILRKEHQITQEYLAEKLGISNRTISRWENGNNMPDLDFLIEMSDYFNVGIDELLNGERRNTIMETHTEKALLDIATCSNEEKERITKPITLLFFIGTICLFIYCLITQTTLYKIEFLNHFSDAMLGASISTLIVGLVFTTTLGIKTRNAKKRLTEKFN